MYLGPPPPQSARRIHHGPRHTVDLHRLFELRRGLLTHVVSWRVFAARYRDEIRSACLDDATEEFVSP